MTVHFASMAGVLTLLHNKLYNKLITPPLPPPVNNNDGENENEARMGRGEFSH